MILLKKCKTSLLQRVIRLRSLVFCFQIKKSSKCFTFDRLFILPCLWQKGSRLFFPVMQIHYLGRDWHHYQQRLGIQSGIAFISFLSFDWLLARVYQTLRPIFRHFPSPSNIGQICFLTILFFIFVSINFGLFHSTLSRARKWRFLVLNYLVIIEFLKCSFFEKHANCFLCC